MNPVKKIHVKTVNIWAGRRAGTRIKPICQFVGLPQLALNIVSLKSSTLPCTSIFFIRGSAILKKDVA